MLGLWGRGRDAMRESCWRTGCPLGGGRLGSCLGHSPPPQGMPMVGKVEQSGKGCNRMGGEVALVHAKPFAPFLQPPCSLSRLAWGVGEDRGKVEQGARKRSKREGRDRWACALTSPERGLRQDPALGPDPNLCPPTSVPGRAQSRPLKVAGAAPSSPIRTAVCYLERGKAAGLSGSLFQLRV